MTKKTIKPKKMLAGGIIKAAVKAGGKAVQAANSPQPPAARGRGLSRAIGFAGGNALERLASLRPKAGKAGGNALERLASLRPKAGNVVGSAFERLASLRPQGVAVEKAKGGSVTKKPKKKV